MMSRSPCKLLTKLTEDTLRALWNPRMGQRSPVNNQGEVKVFQGGPSLPGEPTKVWLLRWHGWSYLSGDACVLWNSVVRYVISSSTPTQVSFVLLLIPTRGSPSTPTELWSCHLERGVMNVHLTFAIAGSLFRVWWTLDVTGQFNIGESGAGKTENTKKVISTYSLPPSAPWKEEGRRSFPRTKLFKTNPVLEAWECQDCERNDNSSRFGKFIRILISMHLVNCLSWHGCLSLEKSRLTYQQPLRKMLPCFL